MSATSAVQSAATPVVHGAIAQFTDPADLLHAAEKVRDAGFKEWDAHSPFPIHGMDDAMGEKRSKLPWVVATFALIGFVGAITLQWWTSAEAYPLILSGKPLFSHVAFFPITFAFAVLFAVLSTVVGLVIFMKQAFHHPVFYADLHEKASDDGFLISVLASDSKFDTQTTVDFLRSIGGQNIELLEEK
jgi:Alternative complex III, ActD subunit